MFQKSLFVLLYLKRLRFSFKTNILLYHFTNTGTFNFNGSFGTNVMLAQYGRKGGGSVHIHGDERLSASSVCMLNLIEDLGPVVN